MASEFPISEIRCRTCHVRILVVSFWRNVDFDDGCWLWKKDRNRRGYGKVHGHVLAHRAAWEFTNGPVPDGMCVLHQCDVPACCNPTHLFLGTQADNVADMDAKGRRRIGRVVGEDSPHSVLTDNLVRQIRQLYGPARGRGSRLKPTQKQVAERLGVKRCNVSTVVNNQGWSHVV